MEVAIGFGLVLALVGIDYAVMRAVGRLGTRFVESTRWRLRVLRTVLQVFLLASIFAAFAITLLFSPLVLLVDAVGNGIGASLLKASFATAWTTAILALGHLALRRGTAPALDAAGVREPYHHPAHGLGDRYRRRQFRSEVVFFGFVIGLVYAGVLFLAPEQLGFLIPPMVVGFFALAWWIRPAGTVTVAHVREPTAAERSRLESCYDRIESPVPTIFVYDDAETNVGIAAEGGDGLPTLWIGESVLALDDDALAVVIAQAERRDEANVLAFPIAGFAILFAVLSLALVGVVLSSAPLMGGALLGFLVAVGILLGLFQAARRRIFAVDRAVAERFDGEAVREAYGLAGDRLHTIEDGWHDDHESGSAYSYEPSVAERIQRLAGDGDVGAGSVDPADSGAD